MKARRARTASLAIALAVGLALTGTFAAGAEAHKLSTDEALGATLRYAKKKCEKRFRGCEGWMASACRRESRHRISCKAHVFGRTRQTGKYDCHRFVWWQLKPSGEKRRVDESDWDCVGRWSGQH